MKIVVIHFLIVQSVEGLYFCIPIVESYGKNSSERSVPFPLHTDIPYTESPYYELIFIFESASALSVGICTTGFGGFLCAMNLYTAGQFKILQCKLEITCAMGRTKFSQVQSRPDRESSSHDWLRWSLFSDVISKDYTDLIKDVDENQKSDYTQFSLYNVKSVGADESNEKKNAPYILLRECIQQHQLLIHYMEKVENLFSGIMLAQTLGAVLELCFAGFQILLGVGTSKLRTALSIQFLLGSTVLLLFFSWSSHEIIIQSQEIAEAAYRASWYGLGFTDEGRAFRQSLLIIIARARKPCILTVGKFAPMSLNTFTSVFNTSLSYFTILRQVNEGLDS
uniref:Olfactory receptor 35 n=1 Tax=Meteorus pulchricornis TaxID=51522 RepID=A0A1S5VFM4_9HYME|nr:olfactory receptor 35 [Meteorus pulchricornis]